ncbi:spore protease YyaC [Tissierella sp. P1]|uniref:spore protease YyaC n=1 Tax=Tissierella sp. P1 TaxID=1280483 RepID=UPI001303B3A7|nr:spore protease YyaC [Tissierella sp. P1]
MITINSQDCKEKFYQSFKTQLEQINKTYDEICIACIGTDRSTGDSLGPLVGYKLGELEGIRIVGNLDKPLHAQNLKEFVSSLDENTLVIAVDAALGKEERVGFINVKQGALRPGAGVGKDLPHLGDIAITGIVNIGGMMEFMVLQNTRLSVVMKMADVISEGLKRVLKEKSSQGRQSQKSQ